MSLPYPAPLPDPNYRREAFFGCEDSVSFSYIEMNAEGRGIRPRHLKMKLLRAGSPKGRQRERRIGPGVVFASAAFAKSNTRRVRRTHALRCGRLRPVPG